MSEVQDVPGSSHGGVPDRHALARQLPGERSVRVRPVLRRVRAGPDVAGRGCEPAGAHALAGAGLRVDGSERAAAGQGRGAPSGGDVAPEREPSAGGICKPDSRLVPLITAGDIRRRGCVATRFSRRPAVEARYALSSSGTGADADAPLPSAATRSSDRGACGPSCAGRPPGSAAAAGRRAPPPPRRSGLPAPRAASPRPDP